MIREIQITHYLPVTIDVEWSYTKGTYHHEASCPEEYNGVDTMLFSFVPIEFDNLPAALQEELRHLAIAEYEASLYDPN